MTRVFEKQTFVGFRDRDSRRTFTDIEFRRCTFVDGHVSITDDPALRSTIRRVRLIDCVRKRDPAGLGCPVIEDCLVENLKTEDLMLTWGAVFKHVTLKGRIGRIMLNNHVAPVASGTRAREQAFLDANAEYYATVDWALDISKAEFQECDIRGIPAHLIRRDPETQVVVTRERALTGRHRRLDFPDPIRLWPSWIDGFLEDGDPAVVLVAPKRSKHFRDLLIGLDMLRKVGVAEQD
ncbi:MAG: hypothetical protein GY842_29130 [bacterium]|nr:hypothetical protein [bacterium]